MTTESVLAYLERAEAREEDIGYRDLYRLSWITVHYACQDSPLPYIRAHYQVFGVHPDKLPEKLKQRRLAQLERWYGAFWGELPPKKPVQSVVTPAAVWKDTLMRVKRNTRVAELGMSPSQK